MEELVGRLSRFRGEALKSQQALYQGLAQNCHIGRFEAATEGYDSPLAASGHQRCATE